MQSHFDQGAWVSEITWSEVAKRITSGAVGVLPVGAACKEHGLHLPMNTDQIQAEWLAQQLVQSRNVLVWPAVTYGYYPAFVDYPGSCSLSKVTFSSGVCDILQCLIKAAINKVIVINTGISTIAPLETAINMLEQNDQIILFNAYDGPHYTRVKTGLEEQTVGGHADEIETSIMLSIAPALVDMTRAERHTERMQRGPLNRSKPDQPNYSPSGVTGDATLASPEKGKLLVQAILDDLNDLFEKFRL